MLAKLILNWAHCTFGPVALNPVERSLRIVEEACEVAQADGCPKEQLHAIIERTYSRPADSVTKELGGLLVTVYARCGLGGWSPKTLLADEVNRVLSKPRDHWRAKHDDKVRDGTVTGPSDDISSTGIAGVVGAAGVAGPAGHASVAGLSLIDEGKS